MTIDEYASYKEVIVPLRAYYDSLAMTRDEGDRVSEWKAGERLRFLSALRNEGRTTLLEVGAGTGIHGKFFLDQGLDVVSTDLSPEHVRRCEQRGLTAYTMDFMSLDFGGRTFDSVFAMNCLLHVPSHDFVAVLEAIRNVLTPGGLLYLGQYGGYDWEGVSEEDFSEPKRFWSFFTDDRLREMVGRVFTEVDFRQIVRNFAHDQHYQALILKRPAP